ncbi:MAG: helix-turn-helix domain-containing protein [Oscillospiraceae bacterium]
MDCQDYITEPAERKKGQHLQREERGAIQHLKRQGYSNRAIAREIGCSPSTVANELRRGTPPRKSNKGRKPGYSAKRGEAVYKANRKLSPETPSDLLLRPLPSLGDKAVQRTQVVSGCLRRLCPSA